MLILNAIKKNVTIIVDNHTFRYKDQPVLAFVASYILFISHLHSVCFCIYYSGCCLSVE